MNKDKYVDAINNLKAPETLINRTIDKIRLKRKTNYIPKIVLQLANVIAIILIISSFLYINNNYNKSQVKLNEDNQIVESIKLEKLGSFENLVSITKKIKSLNSNFISDSIGKLQESKDDVLNNIETSKEYSRTNIQVENVDEADIIKTDGDYIYYISDNSKLAIVDAKDLNNLKLISEIKSQDNVKLIDMYINNNKLILLSSKHIFNGEQHYNYKSLTVASVYDVSNKNDINILREIEIEGNYLSSRMINEYVYFISNKHIYDGDILREETDQISFLPQYKDTTDSKEYSVINYDSIYCFPTIQSTTYTIIAGFNINDNKQANIETFLGLSGNIYCSQDNLYLTGANYNITDNVLKRMFLSDIYDAETIIYKFNLNSGNIKYVAEAKVEGIVLNQFSMDENAGYFRIATTKGNNVDNRVNNIYVMDSNLKQVGKLENLAKGERIYSVRFIDKRCYMVTYKDVDPLFVIDLLDPTNPKVLGELKIPGYSTYLHPYDENHIIGFGNDTQIKNYGYGDVNVITGMKMALFNVSDVNNPKELYNIKIGDKGTYSEVLYNHRALLFSKERNIIAFPITITENDNVSNNNSRLTFQGAIVYGLDLNSGFNLRGKISHTQVASGFKDYNYTKAINRIIYIRDNLITASFGLIKSTNINTMKDTSSIEIVIEE